MSKYQFTLKPIDNFFFGNEINFRPGIDNDDKKMSYIIRSNKFPQQTTILGMLRKEILIKEGKFSEDWRYEDKEVIDELIGKESFKIEKTEQSFGKIKKMSPVLIFNKSDNKLYLTCPLNHKQKKGEDKYKPFNMEKEVDTCFGKIKLPSTDYEAKKGLFYGFINSEDSTVISEDNIFKADSRIGIEKQVDGGSKEEKYYKTISYRLDKEFCFYFEADIEDVKFENYKNIVTLGTDGLGFVLEGKKIEESLIDKTNFQQDEDSIVLLSDSYINEDVYESCYFAISEAVDFRNLNNKSGIKGYSRNKVRYTLVKRGSVLYSSDLKSLKSKLNESQNLRNIGYNIYK